MLLSRLQQWFDAGNSWHIIVIMLIISVSVLAFFSFKKNMVSDWAFGPVIEIPKEYQKLPLVKTWFEATRGFNYEMRKDVNKSAADHFAGPTAQTKTKMNSLMSGWACIHMFQHFCIAFFCPKLVPLSFVYGIAWEIIETSCNAHCLLDIFWNMCGALLGLLCRFVLFPVQK